MCFFFLVIHWYLLVGPRQHFFAWAASSDFGAVYGPDPCSSVESVYGTSRYCATWTAKTSLGRCEHCNNERSISEICRCGSQVLHWGRDLRHGSRKDILCSSGRSGLQGLPCPPGGDDLCYPHCNQQHRSLEISRHIQLGFHVSSSLKMFGPFQPMSTHFHSSRQLFSDPNVDKSIAMSHCHQSQSRLHSSAECQGTDCGKYLGVALAEVWGIVGEDFQHLPHGIISKALFRLVPIPFILMLSPDFTPDDPIPSDEDRGQEKVDLCIVQ